jgi:hypothetical protein
MVLILLVTEAPPLWRKLMAAKRRKLFNLSVKKPADIDF